jgi:glycosyltransferase involved in cell wall biosynthesis
MKLKRKKITALIPCYNEENGVGEVIKAFPQDKLRANGFDLEIIVIDNNSTDRTAEVANALGVTVLHEPKKGKGNAIRLGFNSIDETTDYVVMLDGDNSYRPEEILRLIELLDSGFCNVVIGSRLSGRISDGSMTTLNRTGNWIFSHLVRFFYRVNVTDVLTGYFAWKRESLERLRPHLISQGFAIEMEMVTKMALLGEDINCVPISYVAREGETNLRPFYDGSRILWMFAKNMLWKPTPKKPQRIAFVSDSIMPYFQGGKEKRLYEISRRLVKEGREVHIYTMKWWEGPKTIQYEGVYFHAICKLHPLYKGERRSISEALWFSLAVFKLAFVPFDILDVDHMPFFPLFSARIVTWIRGKKLYATWHEVWGTDYWRTYLAGDGAYLGAFTEWMAFKLPDVIIANSQHTARKLQEVAVRARVHTVSLGADVKGIYEAEVGVIASDIIYVGRLMNHKGVDLLVNAIKILKESYSDISALIVGDGPERASIIKLIAKLDLKENITLLGSVDGHENLYGLMKASKMLVLPSTREGFGLVLVEANAAGIPVITTRHQDNAAKELVSEGVNGFLSEPTPEAIAEKIEYILTSQTKLHPRAGIEKYDWPVIVQSLEKAFA